LIIDNCGIFFENDFKYVAEGDSFIIHYTFFQYPLAGTACPKKGKWQQ